MLLPTISNLNQRKKIFVSAPGKLHLIGEHAVVYGQPAIIAAVNKRSIAYSERPKFIEDGHVQYDEYINICINESFKFFKKKRPKNFNLSVKTQIPIGSGMGSSASIAVAVAGFVSKLVTGKIDKEDINSIAFTCEIYLHGDPSGGDNAACTYGGFILYKKRKKITNLSLSLPKKIASQFFIIHTGRPKESTKEMIHAVSLQMATNKKHMETVFKDQGKLTLRLLKALKNKNIDVISQTIKQAESNLEKIGVVSTSAKKLIREIEKSGGVAKICGAGGIRGASGIVLVFDNDFERINRIAKKFNLYTEKIVLGEKGVKVE